MADDTGDLGVDQLLRDDGALLRVGLIVLGDELELDLGAGDFNALAVELVDRHARGILVVLAQVRLRTGERRHVADFHSDFGGRRGGCGRCCGRRRSLGFFLLAAADHGNGGSDGERDAGNTQVRHVQ